jgi:hypothetical protein
VIGRPQSPACAVLAAIVRATADEARSSFRISLTSLSFDSLKPLARVGEVRHSGT